MDIRFDKENSNVDVSESPFPVQNMAVKANNAICFDVFVKSPEVTIQVPTLRLEAFSETPFLQFGKVPLGTSQKRTLKLYNAGDVAKNVSIDKLPPGITVEDS